MGITKTKAFQKAINKINIKFLKEAFYGTIILLIITCIVAISFAVSGHAQIAIAFIITILHQVALAGMVYLFDQFAQETVEEIENLEKDLKNIQKGVK